MSVKETMKPKRRRPTKAMIEAGAAEIYRSFSDVMPFGCPLGPGVAVSVWRAMELAARAERAQVRAYERRRPASLQAVKTIAIQSAVTK